MNTLTQPRKLNRTFAICVAFMPIGFFLWIGGTAFWRCHQAEMQLLSMLLRDEQLRVCSEFARSGIDALFYLLLAGFGIVAFIITLLVERLKNCEARLAQLEKP